MDDIFISVIKNVGDFDGYQKRYIIFGNDRSYVNIDQ